MVGQPSELASEGDSKASRAEPEGAEPAKPSEAGGGEAGERNNEPSRASRRERAGKAKRAGGGEQAKATGRAGESRARTLKKRRARRIEQNSYSIQGAGRLSPAPYSPLSGELDRMWNVFCIKPA